MEEENRDHRRKTRNNVRGGDARQNLFNNQKFSGNDLRELLKGSDNSRDPEPESAPDNGFGFSAAPRAEMPRPEVPLVDIPRPDVSAAVRQPPMASFSFDDEEELDPLDRFAWMRRSRKKLWKTYSTILLFFVVLVVLLDGRAFQYATVASLDMMTGHANAANKPVAYAPSGALANSQQQTYRRAALYPQQQQRAPQSWPVISEGDTGPADEGERRTTLRAEPPEGKFAQGRVTTLLSAKARVRNVGTVNAKNVQVAVRLPSGVKIDLQGPGELRPGDSAVYTVDTEQIMTVGGNLQVEQSCENCRK